MSSQHPNQITLRQSDGSMLVIKASDFVPLQVYNKIKAASNITKILQDVFGPVKPTTNAPSSRTRSKSRIVNTNQRSI